MPGLSDLKIKIKNQPHGLAWINDKERSVLKAMGGSGKSGPMGIPAYYDSDVGGDPGSYDEGDKFGHEEEDEYDEVLGTVQKGFSFQTYDPELGWSGVVEGKPGDPYEEVGLGKVLGDYIRAHPFTKGMEKIGGLFGPKGEALTKGDVHEIGLEAMRTTDPDRDGINDGDEIVDEIKKAVEEEEKLTPMQKYFRDKEKTKDNPDKFGDNQMTPEERLITSLGIENRIIQPFNEWLATQEERIRNLPRWLQATQYREYAKNRTSPASSYQPITASVMKTESTTDKTPATTELFKRLGMKTGGYINDNIVERQMGGQATPMMGQATQAPPPEPKIIYDPEREAAAEKAFRDIQARRISELDETPQTRAEREALQAKGGFYRDEEGQVRDAEGNLQEDWGFDYVAPPPPDPYDPPDTPDTPKWEPPKVPEPIDTTPLPPGLVRNPETGEITVDPEGAKKWRGGSYGWEYEDNWEDLEMDSPWRDFNEQDYLAGAYMEGYDITKLPRGQLGGGWTIERTDPSPIWNPANSPSGYNYALKGPDTFKTMDKPVLQPPKPGDPIYQPMIGQQLQPTGLQGLQQGMQGFGMQSPTPFGTQQPFSSGFGGFGQQ